MVLAAVYDARRRLAAIAAGNGLLVHAEGLGAGVRTRDAAADLARRAAEASFLLAYANGRPVTHLDTATGPEVGLMADGRAAAVGPAPSAELSRMLPSGAVQNNLMTPLWRATRFAAVYCVPRPLLATTPLRCAGPRGDQPVPGGLRHYDPTAYVLALDQASAPGPGVDRLVNALLVDVSAEDPERLPQLYAWLDPDDQPGRLILRLRGSNQVVELLLASGTAALYRVHPVVWLVAGDQPERLAPLVARGANGVSLGGPGNANDGWGRWVFERSARPVAALLS